MLEGFETVSRVPAGERASRQCRLKRNCALSPRQLMRVYFTLVELRNAWARL
jgi:hypothetical protein